VKQWYIGDPTLRSYLDALDVAGMQVGYARSPSSKSYAQTDPNFTRDAAVPSLPLTALILSP